MRPRYRRAHFIVRRNAMKLSLFGYVKQRLKTAIALDVVFALYLAFCLGSGIYFGVSGATGVCIRAFVFMLFVPVVYIAEYLLKLEITPATCALMLFIGVGSLLGSGFNVYTTVPFFDTVLHGISGFVFACIGFSVLKVLIVNPDNSKRFFACLIFGFICSLAIAALWELFEFTASLISGTDIQEDTIVSGFQSFLISGDHSNAYDAGDILQTVIQFKDGREPLVIDGYLDIGLIDTIEDMAICLGGAVIYCIALTADWFTAKKSLNLIFIPAYTGKKTRSETEVAVTE